jgi:putative MATE family efflux protein
MDKKSVTSSTPAPAIRQLFNLAPTIYIELALGISVGIIGTALAARVSDTDAAALALANNIAAMLFILFRLIGVGISVVVTQNLGAKQRAMADASSRAALGASTWLGVFCAVMAIAMAWPLIRLMNAPPEVLQLAAPYLRALALPLLLDAWITAFTAVLRAHLRNRETLAVTFVMHALHLALAWPLMTGTPLNAPLGLMGFALACGISRFVALGLFLWLWKSQLNLRVQPQDWWKIARQQLAPILHIGLPAAAENVAYRLAFVVSVAAVGHLGAKALATQAYVLQISHIGLIFGLAISLGVEIVVGHLIGARHFRAAQNMVRQALAIALSLSLVATVLLALSGPWLLRQFTADAEIIRTGTTLLWLTVALELGRTFNLVVINALRATGDARFPVVAGSASMLLVLAGGSWVLSNTLQLGLIGVWIAYALDEWIRGLIMWHRWHTIAWVPYAKASVRRARPHSA